jgi:hypothetical protein
MVLADLGYGCIAPDHCHDSLVEVSERLSWLSCYIGGDLLGAVFAGLLCNRRKLWQWFAIRASDIRKIAQRVYTSNASLYPPAKPGAL